MQEKQKFDKWIGLLSILVVLVSKFVLLISGSFWVLLNSQPDNKNNIAINKIKINKYIFFILKKKKINFNNIFCKNEKNIHIKQ